MERLSFTAVCVILRELSVSLRRHDLKVKNGGSLP
jgi:hypothetical protein